MKKVIFAAVLAVVAIGGAASSVNALTFYTSKTGSRLAYQCDGGIPTCASQIQNQPVYSSKTNQITPVDPVTYEDLNFTSLTSY